MKRDDGHPVEIDSTNIAWDVDISYNFKKTSDADTKAWTNVSSGIFI